jgi:hypothetical protein
MFIQTPSKSKSIKPNLRQIDPSALGGSVDSYFRGRLKIGGDGNGNGTVRANRRKPENAPQKARTRGPSAGRIIIWSLIIGALGYGYITHVFATQELYSEVNEMRRQYENVQANHATQALTYDRMTGPAEVYRRARELGFIDPGPADHVIIID